MWVLRVLATEKRALMAQAERPVAPVRQMRALRRIPGSIRQPRSTIPALRRRPLSRIPQRSYTARSGRCSRWTTWLRAKSGAQRSARISLPRRATQCASPNDVLPGPGRALRVIALPAPKAARVRAAPPPLTPTTLRKQGMGHCVVPLLEPLREKENRKVVNAARVFTATNEHA